jgi:uncharacterized protein
MKNENYRDNYYGSILDPLHGDIKLSEIEKWCISQPLFSRLRNIRQNTFLYYVFPSANHTRFEHSIGVMHVAGKIFDACQENFATGQKKLQKYFHTENSSFFDLNHLGEKTEVFYQELRLAALLHDLGHGPMSHMFDQFAINKEMFLDLIKKESWLTSYVDGFEQMLKDQANVEHEIISCLFIFYLVHELKHTCYKDPHKFSSSASKMINSISAERVVKMIEPGFAGLNEVLEDENKRDYTEFFSKIVTAFPIDADRMDYLLRDSYFTGVTYGIYDINRIFASFQATLQENMVSLCFKESGLDSILRFIQSRSHLYNQVYFHKTNRAANTMLTYSTLTYSEKGEKMLNTKQSVTELIDFYVTRSDEFFVKKDIQEQMAKTNEEKLVIKHLIDRKLFKRVWQLKIVLTPKGGENMKDRARNIEKRVKDVNSKLTKLNIDGIIAVSDYSKNETFKDGADKSIFIASKTKQGKYTFSKEWKSIGREFELSDMIVYMVRIYLCRRFHTSDEYKQMAETVRQHVKTDIEYLESFNE